MKDVVNIEVDETIIKLDCATTSCVNNLAENGPGFFCNLKNVNINEGKCENFIRKKTTENDVAAIALNILNEWEDEQSFKFNSQQKAMLQIKIIAAMSTVNNIYKG